MRHHTFYYGLLTIFCGILPLMLAGCKDDSPSGPKDNKETNKWIERQMEAYYLWNNEVKDKKPDYSLDCEAFFYSLLSMKDGKTDPNNGQHYYYSTISKNKNYQTKSLINEESTYGFEFALYNIVDNSGNPLGYYYARILYILPGSPAEKANLKRGDWIIYINNQKITQANAYDLLSGPALKLGLDGEQNPREIDMAASIQMYENPLLKDTIIETKQGIRVGYLMYNKFASGIEDDDNAANDAIYDQQMMDIFNHKFSVEGVDEFVLDLRYNGGGYVECARLLGGLIIAKEHKKELFCIMKDNQERERKYEFTDGGSNQKLSRLFVLTSSRTASASEAIVNCLRPFMEVILIGEKTEGKNVGSSVIENNTYEWSLSPIQFKIYNKNYESDYEQGFNPDYELNELRDKSNSDLYELGDPKEYLFSRALAIITGDRWTQFKNRKVETNEIGMQVEAEPFYNSLDRKRINAVLIK